MVIIRPPSEADSLLLPLTLGCSHNRCTFCGTYRGIKFRIRPVADIKADIDRIARNYAWNVDKVFLENGDALVCKQEMLVEVLEYLNKKFPRMKRVGSYSNPKNLLRKSLDDLKALKDLKLQLLYLGVETGNEEMLKRIEKGVTRNQMIEVGKKVKAAGIGLSVSIILGLGGAEGYGQTPLETAEVISEIDPDYCAALTLILERWSPMRDAYERGEFKLATPFQSLQELREIIAHSNFTDCLFTSNHASNYLPIRFRLPQQKEEGLRMLDKVLTARDERLLRPEHLRAL